MQDNLADIIVGFIRTQEEADRVGAECDSIAESGQAAHCRKNFKRLQKKADMLLVKYKSMKRIACSSKRIDRQTDN